MALPVGQDWTFWDLGVLALPISQDWTFSDLGGLAWQVGPDWTFWNISQRCASKTFFGPRCLCQIFVTVGGVLVLVLVEERSATRQQNFVRSPQIAMRPFSAPNAAHTRRKFSTIVKIFAKSEQDKNSKLVALVFSLK